MTDATIKAAAPKQEIGVTGLKVYGGYVQEEFLKRLEGPRGIKVYTEMASNDATVAAILRAIELMLRPVEWKIEPAADAPEANEGADFAESLMGDMSLTWEDFISEALTMLVYGWSYFETVYKRRVGPEERDPAKRSRYTDGRIGIRKLAPRSQDSLDRWEMQDDGGIAGMWQADPMGRTPPTLLPIERCLLFRTSTHKGNPEGRSILRSAYRSWYKLKTIEDVEAVGIERELAGLPVVRIPARYLTSIDPDDVKVRQAYEKIARDVKFNEQGGIVIPSDVYLDADGKPSSAYIVDVKLLSTGGARAIDTGAVVMRYQRSICRSVLADFLMLGTDKGSFALSENKTDLFLRSCEVLLDTVAGVLNRYMLPRVWQINALPAETMPAFRPGRVAPVNLDELGKFLRDAAGAGMPLFPDDELERHVRDQAGLPEKANTGEL